MLIFLNIIAYIENTTRSGENLGLGDMAIEANVQVFLLKK